MEAALVDDMLNFSYIIRNSVAQAEVIKAFWTNLAAPVWRHSSRLFRDNLHIVVSSLPCANRTSTISL
jgi:hypothetical protein